jgi:hypothetical protein
MQSEKEAIEPVTGPWSDAMPCCANVWDDHVGAYHPCDQMADPDSDLDLCAAHHGRLTSIVSFIDAAQTTGREREYAATHARQTRPNCPPAPVGDRDGRTTGG